jgi:acyl carrier protein
VTPNETKALAVLAKVSKRPVAELTPNKDLKADLDLGSAEALELLATLEETLAIEISEVEAAKMRTVGDVLAFVKKA